VKGVFDMANVKKPLCKTCRRNAEKLYLKGVRCESAKCPLDPRKRGRAMAMAKTSEYGQQLREKNKVKIFYGVLEKQFRKYFKMAKKSRGVTGDVLLQLLERRLDNVVYKLNWAASRRMAKQAVVHGHIFVNGKRVDRPSFLVREGDEISIPQTSTYLSVAQSMREIRKGNAIAAWLESDDNEMRAKVVRFPRRDETSIVVNEQLIINFYSK
jgi:small subunit ribosomal protein S4